MSYDLFERQSSASREDIVQAQGNQSARPPGVQALSVFQGDMSKVTVTAQDLQALQRP